MIYGKSKLRELLAELLVAEKLDDDDPRLVSARRAAEAALYALPVAWHDPQAPHGYNDMDGYISADAKLRAVNEGRPSASRFTTALCAMPVALYALPVAQSAPLQEWLEEAMRLFREACAQAPNTLGGEEAEALETPLREHLEKRQAAAPARPCVGVGDSKCNYLANCGEPCNKCGRVHDGQRTSFFRAEAERTAAPASTEREQFEAWWIGGRIARDPNDADEEATAWVAWCAAREACKRCGKVLVDGRGGCEGAQHGNTGCAMNNPPEEPYINPEGNTCVHHPDDPAHGSWCAAYPTKPTRITQ